MDIPDITAIVSSKGHTGTKPCPLCKHVCAAGRDMEGAYAVTIECIDDTQLDLHTDDTVRETQRRLRARSILLPKSEFDELQIVYGYVYIRHGLLHSQDMNVGMASPCMFDGMHTYLLGGLGDDELGQIMRALRDAHGPVA